MPTDCHLRRSAETNYKPKQIQKYGQTALEWLEWILHSRDVFTKPQFNGKEQRITAFLRRTKSVIFCIVFLDAHCNKLHELANLVYYYYYISY